MDSEGRFLYYRLLPYLVFVGGALWVFAVWPTPTQAFNDSVLRLCTQAIYVLVFSLAMLQLRRR